MNRTVLLFGILLLAVAAVIGVVGLSGRDGDAKRKAAGERENRHSSRSERSSKAGSGSAPRVTIPPVDPAKRLRTLIGEGNAPAASFRELEAMAARLSAGELAALIAQVGIDGAEGTKGWVRCALFAEWGRRDPEAAQTHLAGIARGDEVNEAIDQAWVSLLSGWAQQDPIRAHEALLAMGDSVEGRAASKATTAIFRELARQDSALAWKMVRESEGGLLNADTVAGFFAGLRDDGELQSFLADWKETQWDTDEARAAYALYDKERSEAVWNDGVLLPPVEEQQALRIAIAWAQQDLDAALAWLKENGPGAQPHRTWRASQVARDWARNEPGEALAKLSEERYAEQAVFLGHGAILGDPSLATEVLERLPDDNARVSVLTLAVSDPSLHWQLVVPSAGTASHPLDPEARYQYLLDAINTSGFDARRQEELRRQLEAQHTLGLAGNPEGLEPGVPKQQ